MSKINAPEADTTEHTQSEGCECSGHGKHHKELAPGRATNADAVRTSEHAAHDAEQGGGCCGERNPQKTVAPE